ncbi:hypothetical protein [Hymenobacter properus]|uniref:Uncharacterized protein n=1 Tax=Hymenobacter properus TaxID=2791026 RepID=A0A931BBH3_9BACT|nr:hypothetical protein [Hymenobacter properus]MBF9140810.1 hypothetical protein [Hymenobacter properus]MBR7719619.1 hypothetical protein [Microvirga sp. SRT04]
MLRLNTAPDTRRVNPAEMRYLREALAKCPGPCWETSLTAIVVYAQLAHGMDLTDEADALRAERAAAQDRAQLKGTTAETRYSLHA